MNQGHHQPRGERRPRLLVLVALAVGGVVAGVFGLLFVMANDAWVAVHIPSLPWSIEASWAAFEARLAVVILVSFAIGAGLAALLARRLNRGLRRRLARSRARCADLESELENVSRLLASSRDRS